MEADNHHLIIKMPMRYKLFSDGIARWLIIYLALTLFCLQISCDREKHIEPFFKTPEQADNPAIQYESNWWEWKDTIYNGIPVRVKFHLKDASPEDSQRIARDCRQEFERIGGIFNPFNASSELAVINAMNKTAEVAVSQDILDVLRYSMTVYEASNGAFDPTLFPIKALWQNAVKLQRIPGEDEISATVSNCGLNHVNIQHNNAGVLRFDIPAIQFDFGGIAKGYAVDRVAALLRTNGISAALIQLGGEVAAFGDHNGAPWKIGIQHPTDKTALWGEIAYRGDIRVSTSGNYNRPLMIAGRSYYHIFNPHDGKPVSARVLGVTVASFGGSVSNALLDATATATTVLGPEKSLMLHQTLNVEMLILVQGENGIEQIITPDLKGYTRLSKKP